MKTLGTDDSVNSCDCCGRSGLKFTIIVELDSGDIANYGQVCATRNTGKSSSTLKREMVEHSNAIQEAANREYHSSPEYQTLQLALKNRPSNLLGRAAMEYIRSESGADDQVRRHIASKFKTSLIHHHFLFLHKRDVAS